MPSSRAVERTSTQKSFGRKSVVPTVGIKRFFCFRLLSGMLKFHPKFYIFLVDLAWSGDGPKAGHAFLYANQWLEVVCLPGFKAGVDGVEHGDLVKAGG